MVISNGGRGSCTVESSGYVKIIYLDYCTRYMLVLLL